MKSKKKKKYRYGQAPDRAVIPDLFRIFFPGIWINLFFCQHHKNQTFLNSG